MEVKPMPMFILPTNTFDCQIKEFLFNWKVKMEKKKNIFAVSFDESADTGLNEMK